MCTHVEQALVLFVGIQAIGLSVTEACAWCVGGGGGGGGCGSRGGFVGVRGWDWGQGRQL